MVPGHALFQTKLHTEMEVPVRFELTVIVLQTIAFPLGYGILWRSIRELNPYPVIDSHLSYR